MARMDLGKVTGLSAYEIAKKNGFEGTEQDWLDSLDGSKFDDTELKNLINDKVDKVEGKGLSSNDFNNEEKEKLSQLENYDDTEIKNQINDINKKIPTQATETNQLADKDFVNSSITTATADFIGTFNTLNELKATNKNITNNDYAFVIGTDSDGNSKYSRYKYNGSEWVFEYDLNNSSFTSEQWKAINSGITSDWKENIDSDLTDLLSELANKSDSNHTHNNKVNYKNTMMTTLGFEKGSYVSIRDFWQTLYDKIGGNGILQFIWSSAGSAYIGNNENFLEINGGTLIYSTDRSANSTWGSFSALYISGTNKNVYQIRCYIQSDLTIGKETWSIQRLLNLIDLNNKVDKVNGKGLSSNDFTDELKLKLENLIDNSVNNGLYDDTALINAISNKVDKEEGKSLTSNDFTDELKLKLDSLENYNDSQLIDLINEKSDINHTHSDKLNAKTTSMLELGFIKDSVVSITDFFQTLYNKFGAYRGDLTVRYADANRAYLSIDGTETNKIPINGGIMHCWINNPIATWSSHIIFYTCMQNQTSYIIYGYRDSTETGWNRLRIETLATTTQLNNKDLSNVTGTLPISNGGTGATTSNGSQYNLLKDMVVSDVAINDDSNVIYRYTEPNDTKGTLLYKKASLFWDYIKSKISNVLGLSEDGYNGTANRSKGTNRISLNLKSLDSNKFYPVIITGLSSNDDFKEVAIYSQGGTSSLAYNQNRIKFNISNSGWNDIPKSLFIEEYNQHDSKEITIGCIGIGKESSLKACIWLRGGLNYTTYTSNCTLSLKTEDFSDGSSIYTIGENYYGGTNTKVDIYFTPQTTMTKGVYSNNGFTGSLNGTALKATNDSAGNNIVDTYATKTELSDYVLKSEIGEVGGTGDSQSNTHCFKYLGVLKTENIQYGGGGSSANGSGNIGVISTGVQAVIPILELTSGVSNGYSNGRIFNHAKNGGRSDYIFEWKCNKKDDDDFNLTIYNNRDFDKFKMCTFLYEGKKYLGIIINNSITVDLEYYFDGYSSGMDSPLFTIIKYQKTHFNPFSEQIINSEIKNSLTTLTLSDYIPAKVDKTGQVLWSGILNHADDFTSTTDITLSKSIFDFNTITIAYRAEVTANGYQPIATAIYLVCGHQQFQSLGAMEYGKDGSLFFANYFNTTSIQFNYLFPNGNTLRIKNAYGAFEILGVYGT